MFCNQCEQVGKGGACSVSGTCGKKPEVAALQDLLIRTLKGLSYYASEGRKLGITDRDVNVFTVEALFSTLTNVNFSAEKLGELIYRSVQLRDGMREKVEAKAGRPLGNPPEPAVFRPSETLQGLIKEGEALEQARRAPDVEADVQSLQDILLYGMKGIAAYADHAQILGQEDDAVYAFIHESLAAMNRSDIPLDDWLQMVLKAGEVNLRVMELLDLANTGSYGHPVPTRVPLGAKKGKAILVSGHDLKDLEVILKQSEGKGIYVYTHGEMLPCHGYPGLKKYGHFYGHYGTAWQNQQKEFAEFPGAIVMTTNCIQKPLNSYEGNLFTSGVVSWPGIPHISNGDFSPVVEKALEMPGFTEDSGDRHVTTGFARNAVMSVADKVVEAVKNREISHFFLVGGCDGSKPGRSYYTEFVERVPDDCVVLTLACGKFRFFDMDLGDINGIPRLLDVGQCNDAYSAIQIALALSKAFNVEVNELPLSMVLSWYEQKAVAILLTLFHLGIKDIRLGPTLPAFITPNVLKILVDTFGIKPITTPCEDLKAILGATVQRCEQRAA
ncbi:MAG TPA: hydroxylamine reductase [Nitrospirae bacterium]|nr:hydroxylamine reductase [Nitrospirota bacterium]